MADQGRPSDPSLRQGPAADTSQANGSHPVVGLQQTRALDTRRAPLTRTGGATPHPGPEVHHGGVAHAMGLLVLSQASAQIHQRFLTLMAALPQMGTGIGTPLKTSTDALMLQSKTFSGLEDVAAEVLTAPLNGESSLLTHRSSTVEPPWSPASAPSSTTHDRTQSARSGEHTSQEADRLAHALSQGLAANLRAHQLTTGIDIDIDIDIDTERLVRNSLRSAGIDEGKIEEVATRVARQLGKSETRVISEPRPAPHASEGHVGPIPNTDQKSRPRSATQPHASLDLASLRIPREFLGLIQAESFWRTGDDRIAESLLREQQKTNAKLDEIRAWTKQPHKSGPATFARGRT